MAESGKRDAGRAASDLASGREVFERCRESLAEVAGRLGDSFAAAVDLLAGCSGRVVVTGVGKSGHVGRKIAGTLSSTGTPAVFLHAGEAGHGDLGFIRGEDVCIIISKSGKNEELHNWVPFLRERGCPVLAITGDIGSWLATQATIVLDAGVSHEACPHDLAPTTSSTAALVMGDALAVALLKRRGFGPEDFLRFHPGGVLGRRLSLKVADLMHGGEEIPFVLRGASLRETLLVIIDGKLGVACVMDAAPLEGGRLLGVLTDGDLKRLLIAHGSGEDILDRPVEDFISSNPRRVSPELLATDALTLMEKNSPGAITSLIVEGEDEQVLGIIHVHDILQAGLS